MPVDGVHHIDHLAIRAGYTYIAPLMLTGENTSTKELINFTAPFFILGGAVKINSQRLEDTQVGYTSQKYTLDKYTLEKYNLNKTPWKNQLWGAHFEKIHFRKYTL